MPVRGDRKPCTHTGCSGTLWFDRDVIAHVVGPMRQEGKERWLCDQRASHDSQESTYADHATLSPEAGVDA
jgi:hypothetical protein